MSLPDLHLLLTRPKSSTLSRPGSALAIAPSDSLGSDVDPQCSPACTQTCSSCLHCPQTSLMLIPTCTSPTGDRIGREKREEDYEEAHQGERSCLFPPSWSGTSSPGRAWLACQWGGEGCVWHPREATEDTRLKAYALGEIWQGRGICRVTDKSML